MTNDPISSGDAFRTDSLSRYGTPFTNVPFGTISPKIVRASSRSTTSDGNSAGWDPDYLEALISQPPA
jgi:hypothetical protein